ncbi:CBS domain-containing protein, partial [Pseudomonas sp. CrR25]|nr:CBS domain-containing protein [Pseudomonas sp. CrR25]
RDLIARRYDEGTTVTCKADETLAAVYGRMRFHDIDQVPVMEGDRVVGLIDEWDLLRAVKDAPEHFQLPVREAMVSNLQTLDPDVPLERLLQTFDEGHVALIVEKGRFLGLITKSDLLNLWRRTLR